MKKLGKKIVNRDEETLTAYCVCVCGCTSSDPSMSDWYDDYKGEGK